MKKLTPAYGLFYRLNNVVGNDIVWFEVETKNPENESPDIIKTEWVDTKEKTIKRAEKLATEMPEHEIFAYQVGFMERGLRHGEKADKSYIFHYLPKKVKITIDKE
jgi:hypothetical protein